MLVRQLNAQSLLGIIRHSRQAMAPRAPVDLIHQPSRAHSYPRCSRPGPRKLEALRDRIPTSHSFADFPGAVLRWAMFFHRGRPLQHRYDEPIPCYLLGLLLHPVSCSAINIPALPIQDDVVESGIPSCTSARTVLHAPCTISYMDRA